MHKLNISQEVKFLPSESKKMNAVYEMDSGFSDMKGGICCSYLKQKLIFFGVTSFYNFNIFFRYESQLNIFILFNILFLLLFTFADYVQFKIFHFIDFT